MAFQTIDDSALMEALFEVFRSHGYESATLAQLAAATGLKKSSLYHRFPAGKVDMAKAVVIHVGTQLQSLLVEPLLSNKKKPEKRFSDMITLLTNFYAGGIKNCLLNVMNIGGGNTEINALLNNSYNAWRIALARLAKEAGMTSKAAEERAEHFLIVVEGALVIQRLTGNTLTFQQSMDYAQKEFFR